MPSLHSVAFWLCMVYKTRFCRLCSFLMCSRVNIPISSRYSGTYAVAEGTIYVPEVNLAANENDIETVSRVAPQ